MRLLRGDFLLAVADAPDGAVPVVGDEDRAVLQLHDVDRTPDILVVLQEAGEQRFDVFDCAVLVEMSDSNVTAELDGPIPRTMTRDDDLVLVGSREHFAGIETHAERGCVRTHQADWRRELAAGVSPAEFGVGNIALPAIGGAEVLADLGDAVEFVVRKVFRKPVAAVVGEVELLGFGIPVEADGVADADGNDFRARTVEVDTADLAMILVMQHVVAGLADRNIELVVRSDGDELPAVGFVLRQVVVDHGGLRRIVEIVFDLFDLRHLREFGDIKGAVLEGDAVRAVEAGRDDLDLAFAVLVDDGIDLVDRAATDEDRALVAQRERTGIRHAGRVNFDIEARRHLQLS